jgi:hypothetical protein
MTQSTQEREDSLLQALLQEYAIASQLYMNTIAVTYTRFFGFLAVHGALIVGFFLAHDADPVWRLTEFRSAQARDIEKQINERFDDGAGVITTFDRQARLFENKEKIERGHLNFSHLPEESLPRSKRAAWLINNFPFHADRAITIFLIIPWVVLLWCSCKYC